MRRTTILLAALTALMLVPASQAFATHYGGHLKLNITGPGKGQVTSGAPSGNPRIGSPALACSYNGTSASGVCENQPEEPAEGSEYYVEWLIANPTAGSEFGGWTTQKGSGGYEPFAANCPAVFGAPHPALECVAENYEPGEELEITATFCTEGTAVEEEVFNPINERNEVQLVGCAAPAGPTLTLTKEGGEGTVASNPAGIECGGTCSASFTEGSTVTLTASPASGYMFSSWKGCDKGGAIGRQCTVTMSAAKAVVAKFIPSYSVSVTKAGSGLGKVQSSPGGVLCLVNCSSNSAEFKGGSSVSLTAAPSKHFHLVKWTGDCSGNGACSFPSIAANHTVGAEFAEDAQFALTLNKAGGGNGTVKADIAGINCGATCTTQVAKYYTGTEVTLTATPGKGSSLKEWTGACSGSGTCKVTMSAAKTVGAKFE